MDDRLYFNGSGVKDPTAYKAIRKILREGRKKNENSKCYRDSGCIHAGRDILYDRHMDHGDHMDSFRNSESIHNHDVVRRRQ